VYDPEARPLFLAPQVEEAEERWNAWDQDLSEIEHAARANPDVSLEEVLASARDHRRHFRDEFNRHRRRVRRLCAELGADHLETESACELTWLTFRFYQVADLAWRTAETAAAVAIVMGLPPGVAALAAIVEVHRRWQPLVAQMHAEHLRGEGAGLQAAVDLAARLLVERELGDTGIRLFRSQRRVLLDEALELGQPVERVLREQLPGAVLSATSEVPPARDLRRLRSWAMAIVAPRPKGRRVVTELEWEASVMAPPRSWSPEKPVEETRVEIMDGDALSVGAETASVEDAVMARLGEQELASWIEAQVPTLPPRQRQVMNVMLGLLAAHAAIPTSAEIAGVVGNAPSTVRVQLASARRALGVRNAHHMDWGR
jgi:hypothetical protein